MLAGLFHRAISQSGTALNAWAWPTDSLSLARRQAMYAGCNPEDDTSHIVACLKKVDGKTLIDSGDRFKVSGANLSQWKGIISVGF
jgi:carboxylesterase type B